MGFFNKLLGNVISDAIGSTIKKVQENQGTQPSYSAPKRENRQQNRVSATTGGHTKEYFKDILYSEFPKYAIRENIPFNNFYLHMSNEKNFVIYRINHHLIN